VRSCDRSTRDVDALARARRGRAGRALVALSTALVAAACGGTTSTDDVAPTTERQETVTTESSGLTTRPTNLEGTELVVRGALDGIVRDPRGNVLGQDSRTGIERVEAPHGSFASTGDGGQFFLRTPGPHRGAWRALRDGQVTFVVRHHARGEVEAAAATLPVVVRKGATVTLDIPSPAELGSLELGVDDDGDGQADRTVDFGAPLHGSAASDLLSPVSRVEVEQVSDAGGKRLARVTITSEDSGGAGIARIEYALDASNRTDVYTGPFEAPAVGRVIVRAIDRAGNIEAPYVRVRLDP
jgi:hypothetical protein